MTRLQKPAQTGDAHPLGDEWWVGMTAAARNKRKVIRERVFACRRPIHRELGHLGRRFLATGTLEWVRPDTGADVAGSDSRLPDYVAESVRSCHEEALAPSSPLRPSRSIFKPATGPRPTMDCWPVRLLVTCTDCQTVFEVIGKQTRRTVSCLIRRHTALKGELFRGQARPKSTPPSSVVHPGESLCSLPRAYVQVS
jgi:hypothetical protein